MPDEIFPPPCLMQAYQFIFPTLDFSRVRFFKGFPALMDWGQEGMTIPDPGGITEIHVYLKDGIDDPCGRRTFLVIAHELVHVLQIEAALPGLGLLNGFVIKYVTCSWASFSGDRDNALEQEAYKFSDADDPSSQLFKCILNPTPILPCDCLGPPPPFPWPGTNANFNQELLNRCPDIQKREATVNGNDCIKTIGGWAGILGTALLGAAIGTLFGWPWGTIIGFVVGFLVGFFRGFTGLILGYLVAIVGGLIAGIVSLIASLLSTIGGWFTGDGVGNISLIFSTDNGVTFPAQNKVKFESSSEPPALAAAFNQLFVGWVGTDNQLNVWALPNTAPKATFEHSNDDAGPGLAFGFGRIIIVWQDDDNHEHLMFAPPPGNSLNFSGKVDRTDTLGGSAAPALALGKDPSGTVDVLYLAWIDEDDSKIYVRTSFDGVGWSERIFLGETSMDDGTPAIAFGNGRLYVAWTDDDDNNIHVKSFVPQPGGALLAGSNVKLNEHSSDDAGPALAFANGRLFLAWTDDNQHVQFSFSDDANAGVWQPRQQLGDSSDNAGPAVAFVGAGALAVAWIEKN
ncbi:MAG TPA: hypothetical protein VGF06_09790 [Terriglobales bacterium]